MKMWEIVTTSWGPRGRLLLYGARYFLVAFHMLTLSVAWQVWIHTRVRHNYDGPIWLRGAFTVICAHYSWQSTTVIDKRCVSVYAMGALTMAMAVDRDRLKRKETISENGYKAGHSVGFGIRQWWKIGWLDDCNDGWPDCGWRPRKRNHGRRWQRKKDQWSSGAKRLQLHLRRPNGPNNNGMCPSLQWARCRSERLDNYFSWENAGEPVSPDTNAQWGLHWNQRESPGPKVCEVGMNSDQKGILECRIFIEFSLFFIDLYVSGCKFKQMNCFGHFVTFLWRISQKTGSDLENSLIGTSQNAGYLNLFFWR